MTWKTRAFCVTQWNIDCDYEELMAQGQIRFLAYGDEVCEKTGRPHHQTYLYFWNQKSAGKRSLNNIGNLFGPKHCRVVPMRGSFQENEAYCSKEGSFKKLGDEPKQGFRGDLDETKDMIMDGKITSENVCIANPQMYHMYGRTLQKIEEIALRKRFRTWMTKGIWYHGVSHSGKSHRAHKDFDPATCYVKCLEDEWWDGYVGQETVIFNEFRQQIALPVLLDLVDKWPKQVKQRCKAPVPFLAKTLIITSVHHPSKCFAELARGSEDMVQFTRRFDIIECEYMTQAHVQELQIAQKCSEGNIITSEHIGVRRKRS